MGIKVQEKISHATEPSGHFLDDTHSTEPGGHLIDAIILNFDRRVHKEIEITLTDLNATFHSVFGWKTFFGKIDAFDDSNIHGGLAEFLNPLFASRIFRSVWKD